MYKFSFTLKGHSVHLDQLFFYLTVYVDYNIPPSLSIFTVYAVREIEKTTCY